MEETYQQTVEILIKKVIDLNIYVQALLQKIDDKKKECTCSCAIQSETTIEDFAANPVTIGSTGEIKSEL